MTRGNNGTDSVTYCSSQWSLVTTFTLLWPFHHFHQQLQIDTDSGHWTVDTVNTDTTICDTQFRG